MTQAPQHNQSLQLTRGVCHEPCLRKPRAGHVRAAEPRRYAAQDMPLSTSVADEIWCREDSARSAHN